MTPSCATPSSRQVEKAATGKGYVLHNDKGETLEADVIMFATGEDDVKARDSAVLPAGGRGEWRFGEGSQEAHTHRHISRCIYGIIPW